MTGSRVMTNFVYKRLSRILEIRNNPIWVLPYIWRLGQVRHAKFGANISNETLLNAANVTEFALVDEDDLGDSVRWRKQK